MVCFIHMEEVVEEGSGGGKNENNSSSPLPLLPPNSIVDVSDWRPMALRNGDNRPARVAQGVYCGQFVGP